jgi:uncharacterized BrkB/YihY/UPF0761 family membrane protein
MLHLFFLIVFGICIYLINGYFLKAIGRQNWPGWLKTIANIFTWLGTVLLMILSALFLVLLAGKKGNDKN